jgi:hypothetical protein
MEKVKKLWNGLRLVHSLWNHKKKARKLLKKLGLLFANKLNSSMVNSEDQTKSNMSMVNIPQRMLLLKLMPSKLSLRNRTQTSLSQKKLRKKLPLKKLQQKVIWLPKKLQQKWKEVMKWKWVWKLQISTRTIPLLMVDSLTYQLSSSDA